ncbi:MAG: hypothetical protein NVS3B7_14450 [Candidatus Elarobacter sp.]
MSDENIFQKAGDAIKHAAHDAKDAISEVGHKTAAEGEHAKRDAAGDAMTPGEKVGSLLNEGKENVEAGFDRTKRDVRDA